MKPRNEGVGIETQEGLTCNP